MLIISAKSLFFLKVRTYRVRLSAGVLDHCDLGDAKTPFGTRGLFINFGVFSLAPGRGPLYLCIQTLCDWNLTVPILAVL